MITKSLFLGVLFTTMLFALPVLQVHAEEGLTVTKEKVAPTSLVQNISHCVATGDCTLCDGVKVLATIAQWLLGSIGGIAMFFIIHGGFGLLTSAGDAEKIGAGKKEIMGSIIGLFIVLGAWTFVNIVIFLFNPPASGKAPSLFRSPVSWTQIKCGPTSE